MTTESTKSCRAALFLLCLILLVPATGCYRHVHRIGSGGSVGGPAAEERAWYALWGLVPITEPDGGAMAAGATDYTITTQHTFLDIVISFFTGIVTVSSRSVKVNTCGLR